MYGIAKTKRHSESLYVLPRRLPIPYLKEIVTLLTKQSRSWLTSY